MRGDTPLPPELNQYATLPDLVYRGNDEWSSSCPQCGGASQSRNDKSDRFRLFKANTQHDARVWCRSCGFFEWAGQDGDAPNADEIERTKQERARLAEQERQRVKNKIVKLQQAAYWRGWHDAMGQQQRRLWHEQGIIDYMIDRYRLGYCPEYTAYHNAEPFTTPTMTIPHFGPGWEIVNIQHRLLNPKNPGDKYRQMAGLPAAMFLTEPDEPLTGATMVVEGAKKALVAYTHLGGQPLGGPLNIVAVPSKTPARQMLEALKDCDPVYLMLDPDAYVSNGGAPAVNRIVRALGRERVRVIKLPVKPDDFFVIYGGKQRDMVAYMKQAAPV